MRTRWYGLVALSVMSIPGAWAQESATPKPAPAPANQVNAKDKAPEAKPVERQVRQQLQQRLETKVGEMEALKTRASEVTIKIGELASSGKLPTNDESLALMRTLVDEMQQIRETLQKLAEEVEALKGWVEGQNEALPVMQTSIEQLQRVGFGNYMQVQFTDTQEGSNSRGGSARTNSDGFAMRRFRLSLSNRVDTKTSFAMSFDVATGSRRISAELRDAFLTYDIEPSDVEIGTNLRIGQQALPLGYELERSSFDREFPERAQYNQRYFSGERSTGVRFNYGMGKGYSFTAGLWNNLTYNDPQLSDANTFRNLNGTVPAYTAGVRYSTTTFDVGLSGFYGERMPTSARTITTWTDTDGDRIVDTGEVRNTNVPATLKATRRFYYLDATYVGLFTPALTIRGELVFGTDRLPTISSNVPVSLRESDMRAWHVVANYTFNYKNILHLKAEFLDPGYAANDNVEVYGVAWTYLIGPQSKIILAHEQFKEQGFNARNDVTTLRASFRL